jgi:hypothetical protein
MTVRISLIHHDDQKSAALYLNGAFPDSLSKQFLLLFSLFPSSFVLFYLVFKSQKRRDEGLENIHCQRAFVLREPTDLLGFKSDVSLSFSAISSSSFNPLLTDCSYESENHAIPISID